MEQEADDNMIQETPSSVVRAPTTGKKPAGKQTTSGVSAFGVPYTHQSPQTTPHVRNTKSKRSPKKRARPLKAEEEEEDFGELTQECHGLLEL